MTFTPQNFIANNVPAVTAAWLNGVDVTVNGVLAGAQTVPAALTALGITGLAGLSVPVSIANGGTGENTAAGALSALGAISTSQFTAAGIGAELYPINQAEINAGVTPTNLQYPFGWVIRYGADPTGTNDSTTAFNAALSCAAAVYAPEGLYILSGTLYMVSDQTLYGDGGKTQLQFASSGFSYILMSGVTNSVVQNLKIICTAVSATAVATIAAIYIRTSTYCVVQQVELTGMWGAGVLIDCSNYCLITNNWAHAFQASTNYADFYIYCQASSTIGANFNVISFNQCFGGNNEFGIAIEDAYFATTLSGFPSRNLVIGNRISTHSGYGILLYMPGSTTTVPPNSNTYNTFSNNYIEGITGAISSNPESGAGIYVVGIGTGGTVITGNTIFNCCISTTDATGQLAPAGIGISGVPYGLTKLVVSNNLISDMSQGHGILLTGVQNGATVSGNSIDMPSSNNGTGPGMANLLGAGITVTNSVSVTVTGNTVQQYGTGAGVAVLASGANCTDVDIVGGTVYTTNTGYALQVTQSGGYNVDRLSITGGDYAVTNATPSAINLSAIIVGNLTGVTANAAGGVALIISGCIQTRVVGGYLHTTGSVAFQSSGTCTDTFISKDVNVYPGPAGTGSMFSNAGTGCNVEANFTAVPSAGSWVAGDRAVHLGVTSGTAKAWARVTTGSGNVLATDWISEGNL